MSSEQPPYLEGCPLLESKQELYAVAMSYLSQKGEVVSDKNMEACKKQIKEFRKMCVDAVASQIRWNIVDNAIRLHIRRGNSTGLLRYGKPQ